MLFTAVSEAPLKLPDDRDGILSLAVSRHCPNKPKTNQSGHPAEQQCHFEKSTARKHGAEGTRAIPPLSTQPTFRRQAELHSSCSLASTPWSFSSRRFSSYQYHRSARVECPRRDQNEILQNDLVVQPASAKPIWAHNPLLPTAQPSISGRAALMVIVAIVITTIEVTQFPSNSAASGLVLAIGGLDVCLLLAPAGSLVEMLSASRPA
ncbi:MAG: hypothetical protein Q9180_002317 [Flavoplaca navasiana]